MPAPGSVTDGGGYNLIGSGDGTGLNNGVAHDLIGSDASPLDPLLGALANNGGPTQTMVLLFGSPAIGVGDPSQLNTNDQRGFDRFGTVDFGAFEHTQNYFLVGNNLDAGAGSLRQEITNSDSNAPLNGGPNVIQFDLASNGVQTIQLHSTLPTITNALVIDGTR